MLGALLAYKYGKNRAYKNAKVQLEQLYVVQKALHQEQTEILLEIIDYLLEQDDV